MFLLISAEPSLDGPHLSVKTLPLPSCISGALGLLASICLPPSLPHPLAPRNPAARGGLRGWRFRSEIPAGLLGFEWAGEMLTVLPFDPVILPRSLHTPTVGGPLPAWESPVCPQLGLRVPVPPASLPPKSYLVIQGFLPALGVWGPPAVPDRCPSCEEMWTPCPPTLPPLPHPLYIRLSKE